MTVCIAALCENRKSIVLMADKMIGFGGGYIEAELDIHKILPLHKDWYVMLAGNGIGPVFDMIDYAREALSPTSVSIHEVIDATTSAYRKARMERAEGLYLASRGWNLDRFISEPTLLHEAVYRDRDLELHNFNLEITLLLAGFDKDGMGHVFSIDNPGIVERQDTPGFWAIGSGDMGAISMLSYRELSAKASVASALYYAFEAKISGERASGVGMDTDIYIVRKDMRPIKVRQQTEDRLESLWRQLRPREMTPGHRAVLRNLPEIKKLNERKNAANRHNRAKPQNPKGA